MFLLGFLIGGYLIPAIRDGHAVWIAEGQAEDDPSFLERLVTALAAGALWPLSEFQAEPKG